MLSSILKEHQSSQQRRRELEETRRVEAVAATNKLSHALVDHLNSGVAQAYINQVCLCSCCQYRIPLKARKALGLKGAWPGPLCGPLGRLTQEQGQ